ncbi:MAG: trypsin-like peptidase domain-containing protein [Gemmatimonadaceae bacterium]
MSRNGATAVFALALVAGCARGDPPGASEGTLGVREAIGAQRAGASARPARATPGEIDPRRRTTITDAVARVAPAVVTVQTEVVERAPVDPFEALLGRTSGQRITPGLGSGFITQPTGIVVTNAHVVAGATNISVALSDGTTFPARLLGADEPNDLAVLKIEARGLPVAPLGNSSDLLIGETAIAIGNPFGFVLGNPEPSVTTGVISATGRNLIARTEGGQIYLDMIQTDAPINPGNSGGPLVNALGEVIGVNSSIFSPSGGSIGLGFAIPINRVRRVTEDLLAHGAIRRPWIGIKTEAPATKNPRDALRAGVVIRTVVPGSPAARAGVQPGDELVRAGSRPLRNPFDWEAFLLDLRVGERAALTVRRAGREMPIVVTVVDLPEVSAPKVAVLRELELVTLTPAIRADRGISAARGALIFNVSQRVANELGLQPGDVILQVNRAAIERAEDVGAAVDAAAGGLVRIFFERARRIYSSEFVIR